MTQAEKMAEEWKNILEKEWLEFLPQLIRAVAERTREECRKAILYHALDEAEPAIRSAKWEDEEP